MGKESGEKGWLILSRSYNRYSGVVDRCITQQGR